MYGDYCRGRIWTLVQGGRPRLLKLDLPELTTFGEDPDGRLYAASQDGRVRRFKDG